MVKQASTERRSSVRAKRILSIQFCLYKRRGKTVKPDWRLSTTKDMSAGGLTFYCDTEYKTNDILRMDVVMSGILDIFKGYAKVLRVEKKKTGAHFLVAVKFVDIKTKNQGGGTSKPRKTKKRSAKRI